MKVQKRVADAESGLKKGYRLHDARIAYSGGAGSMRSIKYELVDPSNISGLRDSIAEKVTFDNKWLYGNINLNDYLDWRSTITDEELTNGVREPSFLGLWVKALSLGFVFSKQSLCIVSDFGMLIGCKMQDRVAYDNLSKEWRDKIAVERWCDWWKSIKKPKKLENVFDRSMRGDVDVQRVIAEYNENQELKRNTDFRCRLFGIDRDKVPDAVELEAGVSWACDPDFPADKFEKITDVTEKIDRLIDYYDKKGFDIARDKEVSHFMGLYGPNQGYMYGFMGNFFTWIKSGDLPAHVKNMSEVFGFDDEQEKEILRRLQMLREYAEPIPEKPAVISSWASYNNDFGGTLESWYSNRSEKQKVAIEQLERKKWILSEIQARLSDDCPSKNGIIKKTIGLIDTANGKIDRAFTEELESYLAQVGTEINEWAQKNESDFEKLKGINDGGRRIKWQAELSKRVQVSPLFFGESKRDLWEEVYHLKSLIRDNINELEQVSVPPDINLTDKQVDSLAILYQRIKRDGNSDVLVALERIQQKLGVDFETRDMFNRFFVSGFERSKDRIVKMSFREAKLAEIIELANLGGIFAKIKVAPEKDNALRDGVQLSKILTSARLAGAGSDVQRKTVRVHSNLQGYSALISKRDFVARYSIQATNGNQTIPAIAVDRTIKGMETERYFYAFKGVNDDRKTKILKLSLASPAHLPEEIAAPKGEDDNEYVALRVASSRYQIQFLDWFFGKHRKKNTRLEMGGAFTMSEVNISIDWHDEFPVAIRGDGRVFVSQPFTIVPGETCLDRISEGRFLGVDIGEYGLAWALVEAHGNRAELVESGFLSDHQQRILRDYVKKLRENQVQQTFSSPNTKIARIRESLIGAYRNRLEALAIKYRARLCFELEVSVFESGSNRISKIYDSVKRGSINRKENSSETVMSWGKNPFVKSKEPKRYADFNKVFGFENVAAGTSQFCTKCKRWASLAIEDDREYVLESYDDKLFKTKISDGEVRLLGKEGMKPGNKIKGKDLIGRIYDAMRPNEDGLGTEIIKREKDYAKLKEMFGKGRERGNIGLYVCPYTDCHHISDADIQAAFNIAIRGYLKDGLVNRKASGEKVPNDEFGKIRMTEREAEMEFRPVELPVRFDAKWGE